MTNKTIELDYNSNLDQKLISKIGNPFKFDNPAMQDIMNKFYNTNEVVVNKKILVIRMYDMAVKYAENNSVIYITDNKEKYDKFLELINNEKYGGNDDAWFIEDYRNLDVEIGDMKFDIIIGNPPYGEKAVGDRQLHYKIAESLFGKYNEKMIFIMPNRIATTVDSRFDHYKAAFVSLSKIEIVGNPFENVAIGSVGIFSFENKKQNEVYVDNVKYNTLFDITPFTEYENRFMSVLKSNYSKNHWRFMGYDESKYESILKEFSFSVNRENGAMNGRFFSSVLKDEKVKTKDKMNDFLLKYDSTRKACFTSNNKTEMENLHNAMFRPLLRFGLNKMQEDQNMALKVFAYIPDIDWTDDRTKTDEGILEMVGFSKEESKEFADYTKNYMAKIDEQFNNRPRKKRKSKKDHFVDMKY